LDSHKRVRLGPIKMSQVVRDPDTGEQYLVVGNIRLSFTTLGQINTKMRDPATGVSVKDRKWQLQVYNHCFVGKELVDWFIDQKIVSTRQEAVVLGNFFLEHNVFSPVDKKHLFEDDELFYAFEDINKSRRVFDVVPRHAANVTEASQVSTQSLSPATTTSTESVEKNVATTNYSSTVANPTAPNATPTPATDSGPNKAAGPEKEKIAAKCAVCSYSLQSEWKFCPMCATVIPKDEVLNVHATVEPSVTLLYEEDEESHKNENPPTQTPPSQTQTQSAVTPAVAVANTTATPTVTPTATPTASSSTSSAATATATTARTDDSPAAHTKHAHSLEGAKIAKDKNAVPSQEGEVIVIKSTYGANAKIRKNKILPLSEPKYIPTSSAPTGAEHESFERLVASNLHYENATGPIQAMITGTEKRPEALGSSKMVTLFRVDVFRGGMKWTVFRRASQFKELDKKLKSKKLLKSNDNNFPSLGPLTDDETKRAGLEKYLHYILTNEETSQCDMVVTFLYPIQMEDIKPGQEPQSQKKEEKVHAK
jgi:hypothetical protein